MINLENQGDRWQLAAQIKQDINEYCAIKYNTGHREHLGASVMGEKCSRKLWYIFRWVKKENFDGRMQRLFQVGHNAEPRFIEYLQAIGFEFIKFSKTNEQWHISACNGHYGGSLDGICRAPTRYNLTEDLMWLNEFKTNGTGSAYNDVAEKSVIKAKPKHYAQMCQYGLYYQLKYGLYLIENKNDSDITIEIVPLDWNLGKELEKKAQDIISSQIPPPRIAENPSFFECKYCHFADICHNNEPVEMNCRSCRNAEPVTLGEWYCKLYGRIPNDFIKVGCPQHISINGQ
jgi:hypothetical protein